MKVLITGGPVHARLDAVKVVTNGFKGGLMVKLVEEMREDSDVTYLCSGEAKAPTPRCRCGNPSCPSNVQVVVHDGFHDYREKVLAMAGEFDAVILGAAVANLLPVRYWEDYRSDEVGDVTLANSRTPAHKPYVDMPLEGKFPSHDYHLGARVFMEWQVAPRVIDEVRAVMRPGAHLFGFKLLAGSPHDELIEAAHETLLGSGATCVFANDRNELDKVFAVYKDASEHEMVRERIAPLVARLCTDEYYRTVIANEEPAGNGDEELRRWIEMYEGKFPPRANGLRFGTVAVRLNAGDFTPMFACTGRGKREMDETVVVKWVDHGERVVEAYGRKASLNAPLLDWVFRLNPDAQTIVHYHERYPGLETLDYAPPGTVRDSQREGVNGSFNVAGHGCFLLFDNQDRMLGELGGHNEL